MIGGFALGVAGFVYQTVFRNSLASPDIIGVSSGASAGAAAGILFLSGSLAVTVSAFAGALLAVIFALALSALDRSGRNSTIVLAGIAVHSLAQTALMCLKLTADPERELASIEYWIMGSLNGISVCSIGGNKLMADFHGEPMICRILDATEGIFARRVVVTRSEEVSALCQKRGIQTVLHSLPHRSDTVRLGLEAIPGIERCMFATADQPLLRQETVSALAIASGNDPDSIWRTVCDGTPGSPVIFPQWAFPELRNLPEGKGGGAVIKKYPERLRTVSVRDMDELKDVDSPEDLSELLER